MATFRARHRRTYAPDSLFFESVQRALDAHRPLAWRSRFPDELTPQSTAVPVNGRASLELLGRHEARRAVLAIAIEPWKKSHRRRRPAFHRRRCRCICLRQSAHLSGRGVGPRHARGARDTGNRCGRLVRPLFRECRGRSQASGKAPCDGHRMVCVGDPGGQPPSRKLRDRVSLTRRRRSRAQRA